MIMFDPNGRIRAAKLGMSYQDYVRDILGVADYIDPPPIVSHTQYELFIEYPWTAGGETHFVSYDMDDLLGIAKTALEQGCRIHICPIRIGNTK